MEFSWPVGAVDNHFTLMDCDRPFMEEEQAVCVVGRVPRIERKLPGEVVSRDFAKILEPDDVRVDSLNA